MLDLDPMVRRQNIPQAIVVLRSIGYHATEKFRRVINAEDSIIRKIDVTLMENAIHHGGEITTITISDHETEGDLIHQRR